MSEWPLRIDGHEFHPVPQSWIDAPTTRDEQGAGERLYAVSVARDGRRLWVRYAHPTKDAVKLKPATVHSDTAVYPAHLRSETGWPRSTVLPSWRDGDGTIRHAERVALAELWGDELGLDAREVTA